MPPLDTLWNPEELLEIGQVSSGVTCVGKVGSKDRRCERTIAAADRREASKLLLQMSIMEVSAPGVDDTLAPLARLLICKYPIHQVQVGEVVAKWRSQISDIKSRNLLV